MREYIVRQGDCISSIAYRFNLLPDSIWNDPANAELKAEREDPNVLLPGDVVYVRSKELKEVPGATEQRHRFRAKGMTEKLIIYFMHSMDEPRSSEAYILEIDGALYEGMTDVDGKVEIPIPPNAKRGKIKFWEDGYERELELGRLDPITEISGVQGRLMHLGFFRGPIDGKMSEELERAIRRFQQSQNPDKEPTGKLDEETLNMIQEAHGG